MIPILFFGIIALLIALTVVYIVFSVKKAKKNNKDNWIIRLWKNEPTKTVTSSIISIICGILFGIIILLCLVGSTSSKGTVTFFDFIDAVELLLAGVFNLNRNSSGQLIFGFNGLAIGDMFYNAIPLILVGLSVAVAFKTGLFNIGTPGQWLMSASVTLIIALSLPTVNNVAWYEAGFLGMDPHTPSFFFPTWIVWIIAFVGGILTGALWGAIPGLFKAYLNINEVITCIMTNWIAGNLTTMLFDVTTGPFRDLLVVGGTKNLNYLYKSSENGVATWKMGLDKLFEGSQINGGIIIAIVIAIAVYILMEKTKVGFELKACGSNRNASRYAGINAKKNIVISMVLAGALAGAGAALYYLAGNTDLQRQNYQMLPALPFNGIPVALLASNSPLGVIFTSIFMGYLNVTGLQIKNLTFYNEYITSIISAIIVYFSAFSLIIKGAIQGKYNKFFSRFKHHKKEKVEELVEVLDESSDSKDDTKEKEGEE